MSRFRDLDKYQPLRDDILDYYFEVLCLKNNGIYDTNSKTCQCDETKYGPWCMDENPDFEKTQNSKDQDAKKDNVTTNLHLHLL